VILDEERKTNCPVIRKKQRNVFRLNLPAHLLFVNSRRDVANHFRETQSRAESLAESL